MQELFLHAKPKIILKRFYSIVNLLISISSNILEYLLDESNDA